MNLVVGAVALAAVMIAALLLFHPFEGHRLPLVGGGGPSADSVFDDLQSAGLPITDGIPADRQYAAMARHNKCDDSRPFVRSDSDRGWGIICIGLPPDAARGISSSYDGLPLLVGPLYADAKNRDVIVFGLGWPADASKLVHNALDDPAGAYLASG